MQEKGKEKTIYADQIEGRNSVLELLESGKDINKIFVTKGEKHGSIHKIIAKARERKIIIVEKDKRQMEEMAQTQNYQGVIAIVPPFEYCEIEDILNEAKTASENDNLDNNLTNKDYNGTTDNKESQYVPNIDVFSTDKVNSYVKLSDKYEDIKSSAATMLIVGGVGLVLMALIIAKVIVLPISAETSWLFYSVMGGVFIIFVIAGIVSFMHAKQVKIEAAEEDKLIDSINTWANDNLKISDLDQGLDLSQPDEILSRAERIKKALMMEFENADEPLIDELTEQIFHTLYEE
mgnify:CR=1 FL=1